MDRVCTRVRTCMHTFVLVAGLPILVHAHRVEDMANEVTWLNVTSKAEASSPWLMIQQCTADGFYSNVMQVRQCTASHPSSNAPHPNSSPM
jgi:hypothetical protein